MRFLLPAVLAVCPFVVLADDLPSMPMPKVAEKPLAVRTQFRGLHTPKFWDKPTTLAAISTVGLLTADSWKTCANLASGGHEDWLHTQKCGVAVSEMGVERLVLWGAAYAFHRARHDKIAKFFEWVGPAGNAAGLAYSSVQPKRELELHCTPIRTGFSSCRIQ